MVLTEGESERVSLSFRRIIRFFVITLGAFLYLQFFVCSFSSRFMCTYNFIRIDIGRAGAMLNSHVQVRAHKFLLLLFLYNWKEPKKVEWRNEKPFLRDLNRSASLQLALYVGSQRIKTKQNERQKSTCFGSIYGIIFEAFILDSIYF